MEEEGLHGPRYAASVAQQSDHRRILCSREQSKLCPWSDKKSFVRQEPTCPPPRAGGIRSKVADSGREKSTNQKSHVYGENNRDKDGQKAQK